MVTTRSKGAAGTPTGFFERHGNVYLYVPNLIGYARVAFALLGFAVARTSPVALAVAYFFSFVCDELDGRFARQLGQVSTLGVVLDMVTDRVATACLLAILASFYPPYQFAFLVLIQLDIFSHWFQMYATLKAGDKSHKDVESASAVVRFYYQHRIFMGFCCVCCEVLYLALYLAAWGEDLGGGPGVLAAIRLVALTATPGFAIKQFVNLVQLRTASRQLVDIDLDARARADKGSATIATLVRSAGRPKAEVLVAFGDASFDHASSGRAATPRGCRVAERVRCARGLDVLDVRELNTSLVCSRCLAPRRLEPVGGAASPHFVRRCANPGCATRVLGRDANAARNIAFLAGELLAGRGRPAPFSSPLPSLRARADRG